MYTIILLAVQCFTFVSLIVVDEAKTLVSLLIFFHGEVLFSWFIVFIEK